MEELPDGFVTFLFTDVEGSTRLWEETPDSMMTGLGLHDALITAAVEAHGGVPVKARGEGDSHFVVFRSAIDAVRGSTEMQQRLAEVDWPTPRPVRVRASLHTGAAELVLGDYYGPAVNRAARLRAIAHGGQILCSGSTFELVQDHLPEGVTVSDLGIHRLKDLTRPEHVFQLNISGLENSFPPLNSLDAVANNLPEQLTELIGRESELAELKKLLTETRLLTVLAPGGTGKTRLAIQAAADLASEYPDGVFFIALADLSTSGDILQAVAEGVGAAFSSDDDPQTQLLEYLSSRQQLLVFDNFEHLTDATRIVSEILLAAPRVRVIATSRSKLNLTGEAVMPLLGLGTSWDTPETALQTSGMRLFLDAAHQANPGMRIETSDLEPLSEILRLTGGMPLAILLAAAWVDVLSVSDIAAEIAKSLDFLETSLGDVPDRHRSIRAVFDYSWGLLNKAEKDAFAALSVFRGGFTREAAEAVAGASLRDLANLANKTLVAPNPGTGRFSIHELLRQYAEAELAKLPARDRTVRDCHADYYAELCEDAVALFTVGDQIGGLATIEQDLDNIRPAWRHQVATGNGAGIDKMVVGLWLIHESRGWNQAGLALFGEALSALGDDMSDPASGGSRAFVMAMHGVFASMLGQVEAGAVEVATAFDELAVAANPETRSIAGMLKAQTQIYLGRFAEGAVIVDKVIMQAESEADWSAGRFWVAAMKNLRAFIALRLGEPEMAMRLLDESRIVLEPLDDLFYMTWNLGHRGRMAKRSGRLDDALDLFTQSAARATRIGFPRAMQVSLMGLGETNIAVGNLAAAEAAYVESLRVAERTGMVLEMLATLVRIAQVFSASGRSSEAAQILATVIADPASSREMLIESKPIADVASAELEALRNSMVPGDYQRALEDATSMAYRTVAKDLIDSFS
ncbi:MAG: adenylate/guanylate cyclase domain-containing protein [Acidimicrobiia bacterium]